MIQRNFNYASTDIRVAYRIVKETLYNPQYSKVVFILHSQGGIEGGLVLDWLLQELPQDLLTKLEVYTFGNAANHFNNPHRHVDSQRQALGSARDMRPLPSHSQLKDHAHDRRRRPQAEGAAPPLPKLIVETSSSHPSAISDRAIGHIEHYAHTTDFVALWGVLHFASTAPKSHSMPRFIGRVFARTSERGGHQFCQHYLDGMFPLARDPDTGGFTGCTEQGNEFMESTIRMGREGDESADLREA